MVGGVRIHPVRLQRQPTLGMILYIDDLDLEALFLHHPLYRPLIGGSLCKRDRLAVQILELRNARTLLARQLSAGEKGDRQIGNLLLASQVVGGRATFHVDAAIGDQREPSLWGDRHMLDLEVRHSKGLLDLFGKLVAEIYGVSLHLAIVTDVGERNGSFPMAHVDYTSLLDAF